MKDMIEITGVDLMKFVKEVYALSRPQGLGFIHAKDGELADETAKEIIEREKNDSHIAMSTDYVHGRACKMTVFRSDGKLFIHKSWFDHSANALRTLLERCELGHVAEQVIEHE